MLHSHRHLHVCDHSTGTTLRSGWCRLSGRILLHLLCSGNSPCMKDDWGCVWRSDAGIGRVAAGWAASIARITSDTTCCNKLEFARPLMLMYACNQGSRKTTCTAPQNAAHNPAPLCCRRLCSFAYDERRGTPEDIRCRDAPKPRSGPRCFGRGLEEMAGRRLRAEGLSLPGEMPRPCASCPLCSLDFAAVLSFSWSFFPLPRSLPSFGLGSQRNARAKAFALCIPFLLLCQEGGMHMSKGAFHLTQHVLYSMF
ncbi:unnamed protein product [Periconia digitata]|uniref:Uncharacterized protein n=1 Tax=Periconia digitata TaxID=1303443 RepID=A0A9W4UDP5_9PLEO|nr:unnamed protein product [Periconia digitata]